MLSLEQPADAQPQRRARRPAAGLIFLATVVAIIALIGIFLIVIQGTPNASQLQTIRSRNKSMITRVRTAFTPDSTALIGPSGSRAVTWQLGSGKELQSLQNTYEPDSWLHDLQLSPDASMLMVGGDSVIIWDRASGRELLRIPNAQAAKPFFLADQVAFSPDGKKIAVEAYAVFIYDIASGTFEERIGTEGEKETMLFDALSVAFSPDGRYLVVGRQNGQAVLWDRDLHQFVRTFQDEGDMVSDLAFSPDGRYLATANDLNIVTIWEVETGKRVRTITISSAWDRRLGRAPHAQVRDWTTSVAFSPDGRRIAAGSTDATAGVWDVQSGAQLYRLDGHTDTVSSVSFSPDGRYVATNSHDGNTIIWQVADETP
ncbi:WD40 repeat domain-containing protein [Chloroflexia bacterium SDU3-3]|nr:WD40 repeat domain-containing protein [Chloroflexia bacterium SDU3-3]